ncbi:hypothetical protein BGX23_001530 [Mortierella sp. AD031]|nr:hypothetical protein BGX23_001530 [Mortierella sp. AD031]
MPRADSRLESMIPLPTITNLINLWINSDLYHINSRTFDLPSHQDSYACLARTVWLLKLNTNLVELYLADFHVGGLPDLNLLSTALRGLPQLENLVIGGKVGGRLSLAHQLFPRIKEVWIERSSCYYPRSRTETPYPDMTDGNVGLLTQGQESMCDLSSLAIHSVACSIVEEMPSPWDRCPNIERLDCPDVDDEEQIKTIARAIAHHCPKLCHLGFLPRPAGAGSSLLSLAIMKAMPRDKVKTIHCNCFEDGLSTGFAQLL